MTRTKILLVDDKPQNLIALENLISQPDVEVMSALSGSDALALLIDHEFALALLDVQMPGMNGFELARLMRSAEKSRDIPIIFVTAAHGGAGMIFEGYEKGAVDFLLKPLDAHVVRSKVRVFVELDQKKKALREKTEALAAKLKEVEALREAAEAASLAKSRFLANMSHEIRTPLGAVMGFAELLKLEDQSAEDRQEYAAAISRNGTLLLRIINDVLDVAKIEAERLEIERRPGSLGELLEDLRAVHEPRASEKGVVLRVMATGLLPREITTDMLRLKQILNNIVGNAVKFTSKGAIDVRVTYEATRGLSVVRFAVKDSGVGLSSENAARLFQPFMQGDPSTTRRFGGTGLGLVISKQLARLLGGDVTLADTRPGYGSTFVVAVDAGPVDPAALVEAAALHPQRARREGETATADLAGLSVLVADDAKDNRVFISRILGRAGARVTFAENGAEAVRLASTESFDVILMDVQMPELDGYSATIRLRELGCQTPILALTASALDGERERSLSAGCDGYLSKPVYRAELLALVAETVARRRPLRLLKKLDGKPRNGEIRGPSGV